MNRNCIILVGICIITFLSLSGCTDNTIPEETNNYPLYQRLEVIPNDAVKMSAETDSFPPILHSDEFEEPVSMSSIINTAGGEDSPFILPDGTPNIVDEKNKNSAVDLNNLIINITSCSTQSRI